MTALSLSSRLDLQPITATEREVMRQLGISEETWRRHDDKNGAAHGLKTLSAQVGPALRDLVCRSFGLPATATDEQIEFRLEAVDWALNRPVDAADVQEGLLKKEAERIRAFAAELGIPIARPDDHQLTAADRSVLREAGLDVEADREAAAQEAADRERVMKAKQLASISAEERAVMKQMGISEEVWLKHA